MPQFNAQVLRLLVSVMALTLAGCQTPTGSLPEDERPGSLDFEPTAQYPYGRPNPGASEQLQQFAFMIGRNDCQESRRSPVDGSWVESTRTWDAWYTMNGNAIYDSGRSGDRTNANLRMFDAKTGKWFVTFFSAPQYSTGTWSGGMVGTDMVLKRTQAAPGNGMEGESVLTFSDISASGFSWLGQWRSLDGTIVYPFWKMSCVKRPD